MEARLRFRSKVGITFGLASIVLVAIIGEALFASLSAHAIAVPVVLLLVLVGWLWIALGTSYVITATTLCVRSGPLRWRIPLASIWRLRAGGASWAAPALSLHRIEVSYRQFDSILISPRDKAAFVEAIRARVPDVLVEGMA